MHVDFPEPMLPSMDTLNGRFLSERAAAATDFMFHEGIRASFEKEK